MDWLDDDIPTFEKIVRNTKRPTEARHKPKFLPRCVKGKKSYRNRKMAEQALFGRKNYGGVEVLEIYKCKVCPYWHLTSHPFKKK